MHFPLARPQFVGVGRLGNESRNGRSCLVLRNRQSLRRPLLARLIGAAVTVAIAAIAPPAALFLALASQCRPDCLWRVLIRLLSLLRPRRALLALRTLLIGAALAALAMVALLLAAGALVGAALTALLRAALAAVLIAGTIAPVVAALAATALALAAAVALLGPALALLLLLVVPARLTRRARGIVGCRRFLLVGLEPAQDLAHETGLGRARKG